MDAGIKSLITKAMGAAKKVGGPSFAEVIAEMQRRAKVKKFNRRQRNKYYCNY